MFYNEGMSIKAVGQYLKQRREEKGFSRDQIAEMIGTSNAQILRIERGGIDTRGSLLLRFVRAIEGSADDVIRLLLGEEHPIEHSTTNFLSEPIHQIAITEMIEAMEMLIAMQKKQKLFHQWVSYGKYLLENES